MRAPGAEQITGYVLAGGQSRRMGGLHKALVEYEGQPLYKYAVANLATCTNQILINSQRNRDEFEQAGFIVVEDTLFLECGPVAGIYTALSNASTPFVAIAACDQLALPEHVYRTLALEVGDSVGAYACSDRDVVPTCAVLPATLVKKAHEQLARGEFSLMAFMHSHARPVTFKGVQFGNVNRLSQLDHEQSNES